MELEKFARQLRLMELLSQNHNLKIEDISHKLNMSKRTIYRYIDFFKQLGFVVQKDSSYYRLDYSSPFFKKITDKIAFTEDEGITLSQILNSVYSHSAQVRHLREKLSNLYNPEILAKHGINHTQAENISILFQAIREQRIVLLKNYMSPSSGKCNDRIVEPYLFLNENAEIRCYELASNMNKTFKISRAEHIELLELNWSHKERHAPFYSDLFHFSGEKRTPVSLIMGALSTSLLLDEFPDASRQLQKLPDGRHLLQTEVCSYRGIGRFVLGLYDDIEIHNSPDFEQYISTRITDLCKKIKLSPEQF